MVKLVDTNAITPKKKPIRNWGYTSKEGGVIKPFTFPETESAMKRMENEISNPLRWGVYPGPNPEGGGSRNYTMVRIIPAFSYLRIHSMFFPDGRVWDSTVRKFRPIRDYELNEKESR